MERNPFAARNAKDLFVCVCVPVCVLMHRSLIRAEQTARSFRVYDVSRVFFVGPQAKFTLFFRGK